MAAGRPDASEFSFRKAFLWTEIFRTFQVAIHPRKLVIAGAGILAMSLGWYVLSMLFYTAAPDRKDESLYGVKVVQDALGPKKADGTDYTAEDIQRETERFYKRDLEAWKLLDSMAGPNGGRLRTLPWYEYRGPNPYIFMTTLVGGNYAEITDVVVRFLVGTVPVLIEPLVKLLLPIVKIVDPNCSTLTRFYLLLCLVWGVAVWSFFGGIITRIAAMEFVGKERTTTKQAVQFVVNRYVHYLLSPLAPLLLIAAIVLGLMLFGFVALIPILGDVILYGVGLPLVILGGLAITILLVGLTGYPLMNATLSVEGTDTFDAFSRSFSYVLQAPWSYLWYSIVSISYGAIVTLFVVFVGSLSVYASKWAVSQAPLSEYTNRKPDYLFAYAPESFGWKQLMLKGGPLEQNMILEADPVTGRTTVKYDYADKPVAEEYRKSIYLWEKIGAGMACFWLILIFMLMIGFSYSYFWSASTMIYLLMRKKVDDTDMEEIFLEEPLPAIPPLTPPSPAPATTTGLPMVPPPPVVPVTPPAPVMPVVNVPTTSAPLPPMPVADMPKPEKPTDTDKDEPKA